MSGHLSGDAARVAGIFGYLADRDFRGYSPLYEFLARRIATDEAIPTLVTEACQRNHAPILFFACVHDLALREPTGDLAVAYRAVSDGADPVDTGLWPTFQALVAVRADEIDEMLRTREVQTNEVGRAAALIPVLTLLGQRFDRPLALIELGTSAGLNLVADRYQITYRAGDGQVAVGPPGSPVQLSCEVHGPRRPPLVDPTDASAPAPARLGSRLGIDRRPVDVTDPASVRWLQACVWPDLHARRARLDAALALAGTDPPPLWAGDAVDLVEEALATIGPDEVPCVITTWVLAYLARDRRLALHDRLEAAGSDRTIAWVTAEYEANVPWLGPAGRRAALDTGQLPTRLGLEVWDQGASRCTSLAWMHAHGQWLEWLEDPS